MPLNFSKSSRRHSSFHDFSGSQELHTVHVHVFINHSHNDYTIHCTYNSNYSIHANRNHNDYCTYMYSTCTCIRVYPCKGHKLITPYRIHGLFYENNISVYKCSRDFNFANYPRIRYTRVFWQRFGCI